MVVAGLLLGNQGRAFAMSDSTREHLDTFWELVDEILNALLFLLIGLEVLVLHLTWGLVLGGAAGDPGGPGRPPHRRSAATIHALRLREVRALHGRG